jgi:hypothetical protein
MPIIAGRASAAYGAGFGAVTTIPYAGPYGAYDSLGTVSLTASTASVTFTGIPDGYKHLQIRGLSRSSRAVTGTNVLIMRFNQDAASATYWSTHNMFGNGTSAYAQSIAAVGANGVWGGNSVTNSSAANLYSSFVTDILDYANTNKYKTTRSFQGSSDNGGGNGIMGTVSGIWLSTSAITSVTLIDNTGHDFMQYSSFALYGVK